MRLVNFGVGEISDRLSILALKRLFGAQAGKDITHFTTEHTALLSQVRSRTLNGKWFEGVLELAAVNAALWHMEDDLREWQDSGPGGGSLLTPEGAMEVATLALRIQAANDQRAALIERINKDTGDYVAPEKVTVGGAYKGVGE